MGISVLWEGRQVPNTLPACYFCSGEALKLQRGGDLEEARGDRRVFIRSWLGLGVCHPLLPYLTVALTLRLVLGCFV